MVDNGVFPQIHQIWGVVWHHAAMQVDELSFSCPRCAQPVQEAFYGPCVACRDDLRATYGGGPREDAVAVAAYEPKMNVTPNAVALKE